MKTSSPDTQSLIECYAEYRCQSVSYSRKCLSWRQVLSYKYQYLARKYKYKYQYPNIVFKYRPSTSTSTQYNKTLNGGSMCLHFHTVQV